MSFVILAQKSTLLLLAVFGGELALYLVVKAARRDFTYWFPVTGLTGILLSFTTRVLIYLAVNWTACVHFRHPFEVSGLVLSCSIFAICAIGIVAALDHGDSTLILIMSSSSAGLLGSFAVLLFSINREYVATFYNTTTGPVYTAKEFFSSKSDEHKFDILTVHESLWRHIKDDVRAWLNERLPSWVVEELGWLTD